ncbi:MAG: NADH-quinone oxidoreductase subunit NuoE [Candidatus Dormibacteraceae bacterium]
MTLSEQAAERIRALPAQFPQPRSAVMPALDIAQEEAGHLSPEAMAEVAELLNLDSGYVEGVATFYSLFHFQPLGRNHFYICTNLACMLRGSADIVARLKQLTGLSEAHEVTSDGLFSFAEVECLGACEYAPMMRYHESYHYDLTPEQIDRFVEQGREAAHD